MSQGLCDRRKWRDAAFLMVEKVWIYDCLLTWLHFPSFYDVFGKNANAVGSDTYEISGE